MLKVGAGTLGKKKEFVLVGNSRTHPNINTAFVALFGKGVMSHENPPIVNKCETNIRSRQWPEKEGCRVKFQASSKTWIEKGVLFWSTSSSHGEWFTTSGSTM